MKFIYVDETGDKSQGDVFVMTGLLIDAYSLRICTATFDDMITEFLKRHPKPQTELKTKECIDGSKGWSDAVDAKDRKKFLSELCDKAAKSATVYAVAFSFQAFEDAVRKAEYGQPFGKSYCQGAAMFIAALVQKQMQGNDRNKGHTVFIYDDNKWENANLSEALHKADPWFDPIYQPSKKEKGETIWCEVSHDERFNQIINTAFAIKSDHSSLIQVADAVCYAYRRHLELKSIKEKWDGERDYFASLVAKLKKEPLGHTPGGRCIDFYKAVRHKEWKL